MQNNSRTVIVGCGAVVINLYTPVLKLLANKITLVGVVDTSNKRGLIAANQLGCRHYNDIRQVDKDFSNAIVATPPQYHAPIGVELLFNGKNVLIEKPMASTVEDCDALLNACRKSPGKLSVGHFRRFSPALLQTKQLLKDNFFGEIEYFEITDAAIFSWPVTTDHPFRRTAAGGGVLIDTGSHAVDMALWLFGGLDVLEYADDAKTGVEADCMLKVTTSRGKKGKIVLSRIRSLPSTLEISCENGNVSIDWITGVISYTPHEKPEMRWMALPSRLDDIKTDIWTQMLYSQLLSWSASFVGQPTNVATGTDGADAVRCIHKAYAMRTPLHHL